MLDAPDNFIYNRLMNTTALSTNVNELQKLILVYRDEVSLLKERIRLLEKMNFGPRSEQLKNLLEEGQLSLFEGLIDHTDQEDEPEEEVVPSYKRKKPVRRPIPDHYPREDVIVDVSDEDKICHCGVEKCCIGEETSEQIDVIPAQIKVIRHRRLKYACKACENYENKGQTVIVAPRPTQIFPKSLASAGLLAYIVVSKYVDAMPLYRQEARFKRLGFEISRKSMSDWVIRLGQKLQPLWQLLLEEIKAAPWVGMDETPMRVHREKGRKNTSKSQMWIIRSRDPMPLAYFHYTPNRAQSVPKYLLDGYKGIVVTDAYSAYKYLDVLMNKGEPDIIHGGCWMHARRKYTEIITGNGKKALKPGTITELAIKTIKTMYLLERKADEDQVSLEQRLMIRQEKIKPMLMKLEKRLKNFLLKNTPTGKLSTAIRYTLGNWKQLTVFLDHPMIDPDNRLAENGLRPFVIGRKNWLFAGTPKGAEASAILYSLAITAKENGINEYRYFRHLFEKLPLVETEAELKALLPRADNFREKPN